MCCCQAHAGRIRGAISNFVRATSDVFTHSVPSYIVHSGVISPTRPHSPKIPPFFRSSCSGGTSQKHVMDAATRNLGLHYLSEGRVDEACPLLRTCLETLEKTLRSDMADGDESLDLIPPLTVLSYAEMLAGMQRTWRFSR